jgi:hypothetical protein
MAALLHPLQRLALNLRREHDELARRCEDLQQRADRGDWRGSDAIWDGFRSVLDRHMTHEESWLLPVYALAGLCETTLAQTLRREHAALRQELERLGVARQAHAVRAGDIRALLRQLKDHARREDLSLYAWLDEQDTAHHPPHGAHRGLPSSRGDGRRSRTS